MLTVMARLGPMAELSEEQFQSLYGAWDPYTPGQVRDLLADAPFRWWIAGGWSIEAAGGAPRMHDDIDIAVLARDLPAVREHLANLHLWEAHEGALRPLRPGDSLRRDREQLWARRDSGSPWVLDILLTPADEDRWLFKRDHRIWLRLDEIGGAVDGISYLRPQITLLHKAGLDRAKDRADLAGVLAALPEEARDWLRSALLLSAPDHPWLPLLAPG